MSDLIREDGPATPPLRKPIPLWAGIGLGVLVGLAAALLFLPGSSLGPSAPNSATTESPTSSAPTTAPADPRLLPPDFGYGVVAVVRDGVQGLDVLEIDRPDIPLPPNQFSFPIGTLGSLPEFDATGHFLAATVPMHDRPGGLLVAGVASNMRVLASSVTGFAWHDSAMGVVAFTTELEGMFGFWTAGPGGQIQNVATTGDLDGAGVVAYGDWGWALQDREGETVLLFDPFGEPTRSEPGVLYDSLPDGTLLLRDEGQPVVVGPTGERAVVELGPTVDDVLEVLDGVGDWWTARFAPGVERIALLGGRGLAIVEADRASVHMTNPSIPVVAVNADYVMYPSSFDGVVVVDLESRREFVILPTQSVTALAFLDSSGR